MENTQFKFVRHFTVDTLEFDLYKNNEGNYFTTCDDTESGIKTGMYYSSIDQFNRIFQDKLSGEEIMGIGDMTHRGTVGKPEALK